MDTALSKNSIITFEQEDTAPEDSKTPQNSPHNSRLSFGFVPVPSQYCSPKTQTIAEYGSGDVDLEQVAPPFSTTTLLEVVEKSSSMVKAFVEYCDNLNESNHAIKKAYYQDKNDMKAKIDQYLLEKDEAHLKEINALQSRVHQLQAEGADSAHKLSSLRQEMTQLRKDNSRLQQKNTHMREKIKRDYKTYSQLFHKLKKFRFCTCGVVDESDLESDIFLPQTARGSSRRAAKGSGEDGEEKDEGKSEGRRGRGEDEGEGKKGGGSSEGEGEGGEGEGETGGGEALPMLDTVDMGLALLEDEEEEGEEEEEAGVLDQKTLPKDSRSSSSGIKPPTLVRETFEVDNANDDDDGDIVITESILPNPLPSDSPPLPPALSATHNPTTQTSFPIPVPPPKPLTTQVVFETPQKLPPSRPRERNSYASARSPRSCRKVLTLADPDHDSQNQKHISPAPQLQPLPPAPPSSHPHDSLGNPDVFLFDLSDDAEALRVVDDDNEEEDDDDEGVGMAPDEAKSHSQRVGRKRPHVVLESDEEREEEKGKEVVVIQEEEEEEESKGISLSKSSNKRNGKGKKRTSEMDGKEKKRDERNRKGKKATAGMDDKAKSEGRENEREGSGSKRKRALQSLKKQKLQMEERERMGESQQGKEEGGGGGEENGSGGEKSRDNIKARLRQFSYHTSHRSVGSDSEEEQAFVGSYNPQLPLSSNGRKALAFSTSQAKKYPGDRKKQSRLSDFVRRSSEPLAEALVGERERHQARQEEEMAARLSAQAQFLRDQSEQMISQKPEQFLKLGVSSSGRAVRSVLNMPGITPAIPGRNGQTALTNFYAVDGSRYITASPHRKARDEPPPENGPVRGRARRQLAGTDCVQCREFYESLGYSPEKIRALLQDVSRHRQHHHAVAEPASTPPGFWDLTMGETAPSCSFADPL